MNPTFTLYPTDNSDVLYFEHDRAGDECAGKLWFQYKSLVDYDGVFELPKEVIEMCEALGCNMEYAK